MRRLTSMLAVAPAFLALSLVLTGCDSGGGPSIPKDVPAAPTEKVEPKTAVKGGKAKSEAPSANTGVKAD